MRGSARQRVLDAVARIRGRGCCLAAMIVDAGRGRRRCGSTGILRSSCCRRIWWRRSLPRSRGRVRLWGR
uniref:Uncharacterized protein n=1 Tax=Siphoviridae sp. ctkV91 TaxID=2827924 RepID=A0A8S5TDH0_9CAUD|nr:MAG TPA: hypothetical protein [Siphoviridae sp. ctkV91]